MAALAFDFAPGSSTGPPPDIPVARRGHGATTVEKNWRSNSATAPLELFLNFDKVVAQIRYDVRDVDAPQIRHLHGALHQPYLGPTESDAAITSDWSAVLRSSLSGLGALFQPNIDVAQLARTHLSTWLAASITSGSSAVDLRASLSRLHELFQPNIDAAQLVHSHLSAWLAASITSGSSAVDLSPSLPRLRELFQPNVDAVRLAHIYLTACDAPASAARGSTAVDPPASLSLCLRALYERQSVLTEAQAAALKRQLWVLLEDEEELQSANISVSIPSLHRLIDFLSEHQRSALPSLSITQAGYFAASWSPRKRAKLTIVFRPEGVADWIASDLNATPPVHQKDSLANRLGEFAAWTNA
jgi:hypothetical protein